MATNKEEFLKEFGDAYGYAYSSNPIDKIRASEFKRLERNGIVYLDHAGATVYSELQMENIFKDLTSTIYGNPHSQSDSSLSTAETIAEAREMTMKFCNASTEDYRCIFTSGATAALKLVGESFRWSNSSTFYYTTENHNSVLGIREYALQQGASSVAVDIHESSDGLFSISQLPPLFRDNHKKELCAEDECFSLFAFPSECNFSGLRFNMDIVNMVKNNPASLLERSYPRNEFFVLVDGAKGSATQPPDLSKYKVDFFVLSFYKLFGYPTGLGALILRNNAAKSLRNTYFGGGTVSASLADVDFVRIREPIEAAFEHGSASFLSIASIRHGFKILNRLTFPAISCHVTSLTTYTKRALLKMRHHNGLPVAILYSLPESKACTNTGSIITFNLKRADGSWVGHREVEKLSNLSGIQLRTGCFCNPGACVKFLDLSHNEVISNLEAGHVCWDDNDIINGKPTGAVRISFGYMSSYEDAQRFLDFVSSSFLSSANQPLVYKRSSVSSEEYHLSSISVYPVKSCGGFTVDRWPLCETGLLYDREWVVRSVSGEILTQKKVPEMRFISASIDLEMKTLLVQSPRCESKLSILLDNDAKERTNANAWFSSAVGRSCVISRLSDTCQNGVANVHTCGNTKTLQSFANEAQFLMVSEASVADLNSRIVERNSAGCEVEVSSRRFRPNLAVSGGTAYDEDGWRSVTIGNAVLSCVGGCNRCQMINYGDAGRNLVKSNEPLATLASYRRIKGRILFGALLRRESSTTNETCWLSVGQKVSPSLLE